MAVCCNWTKCIKNNQSLLLNDAKHAALKKTKHLVRIPRDNKHHEKTSVKISAHEGRIRTISDIPWIILLPNFTEESCRAIYTILLHVPCTWHLGKRWSSETMKTAMKWWHRKVLRSISLSLLPYSYSWKRGRKMVSAGRRGCECFQLAGRTAFQWRNEAKCRPPGVNLSPPIELS